MDQPQTPPDRPGTAVTAQPMRYLDRALGALRDLGLPLPEPAAEESPITALLSRIGDLDQDRIVLIARVLNQATTFNEVVREQIRAMEIGDRYRQITEAFNSIRDDAREMVRQVEDGRISTFERLSNVWQKATRGDIADRFRRAGLEDVEDGELEATAGYASFEDFWEPFTFGVGPAGQYLASLPAEQQDRIREACRDALPEGSFSLTARAWYARGTAPA